MAGRRRRTFRVNTKFYVFIAILLAAAGALVYLAVGRDTATARQGVMNYSLETPALLVRDESVIASENYARVNYLVPDQQRVEADTAVADVFRWGYNEKVTNDLVDLQTKILQYQQSLSQGSSAELEELDEQIAQKTAQVRDIAAGEPGDAVLVERELQQLMDERAQYLREHTPSDPQLDGYYAQERQLQERVNSWKDTWRAQTAGVVSYYYDGYEPVINAENIRSADTSTVQAILNGTLAVAETAEGAAALYRLVNNFQWYVVIATDRSVQELANDTVFQVTFDDYPDRQYEGTVIGHITEGEEHLYVLEFNEDIGSLVNTRRADVTIRTSFSGLEVPESALQEADGQQGLYVRSADGSKIFVPVRVCMAEDGKAIVVPLEEPSALTDGSTIEL